MYERVCRAGRVVVVLVGAGALVAACGGGTSRSGERGGSTASDGSRAVAYVHCMRAHGEPNMPAPTVNGKSVNIKLNPSSGVDPSSPQFAAANRACTHVVSSSSTTAPPAVPSPHGGVAADSDCLTLSGCYAPRQFLVAYGIQPLLDHGIRGHGVAVVLPEEAETGPARPQPITDLLQSVTDVRGDLADFDRRFGLPPARIQVITTLAGSSASPWLAGVEEVEDTELVHAIAPRATIRELLVDPADVSTPGKLAVTFASYVRTAVSNGQVMSQSGIGQDFNVGESSWTPAEVATMNSALEYAAAHHLTVVVASGDYGAIGNGSTTPRKEVSLPASDPWALAAGGTTLTANPATGAYLRETAWNDQSGSPSASGGGFSRLFTRPTYQNNVPGIRVTRGVPDVAGEATGSSGMALAFTAPGGADEFVGAGGTSAAAPFWAGLIALADQEAGHPLGFVNPAIYRIAQSPIYHKAFHDITTGNNTVSLDRVTIPGYRATAGWDPVTGWGTPNAQVLVPLLARYARH